MSSGLYGDNCLGLNVLGYSIPNALVYHSKFVVQNQSLDILVKALQNNNPSIIFSDHTYCHGNHAKYDFL